jgi:hypothetical protein
MVEKPKRKKKPLKLFPRELIMVMYDGGRPYIVRPSELTNGKRVALYKLAGVGKAKVRTTVVTPKRERSK